MIRLDTTSEQSIINMLKEHNALSGQQIKQIENLSKESGKSQIETAFELNITSDSKVAQLLADSFSIPLIKLDEIKVSAEREEMKTEVKVATIKISKKDLEMIPTIGGEPDLAPYMQVIPGVVFTGDQGGQLYIRGGSPIQNKVLLDGMIIYSPFHSIGLFSVFDSDIIRNTDVFTGGFNAEYGGRISSIMDIKTIDGNKKHHSA